MDRSNKILKFIEKPPNLPPSTYPPKANSGIYVFEKGIFNYIPDTGFCDFGYEVFPKLIEVGSPLYGYPLKPESYFIDIGTTKNYQCANNDVKAGKMNL